jgi:hypothetical protein
VAAGKQADEGQAHLQQLTSTRVLTWACASRRALHKHRVASSRVPGMRAWRTCLRASLWQDVAVV